MTYVDVYGKPVRLGRKLGTGGEGSVFEIEGQHAYVAKIYHQPAAADKAVKLDLMVKHAPAQVASFAAWPQTTLHRQPGGPTVGLVLPRIDNAYEIHELYSPAHRKSKFPNADWRFLIRVALNCSVAFEALHEAGIVVGDVNQGNLFVTSNALVRLIDCDSFQFSAQDQLFLCPVGVGHFVPPELQSLNLSSVTRTTNHDNFGLAVMLFHLLFMGRHPFSGRYSGQGDMPIEQAISEFRFAYGTNAARFQMAPPPNTITLAQVPRQIALLFERAFVNGSENPQARPTAAEWSQGLKRLEDNIAACPTDPGHYYSNHLTLCPWCKIVDNGGPNLFISVSIGSIIGRSSHFDMDRSWERITEVARPEQYFPLRIPPPTQKIVPRKVEQEKDPNRLIRSGLGWLALICLVISPAGLFNYLIAIFTLPLFAIYGAWWGYLTAKSPRFKIRKARYQALEHARHERDRLLLDRQDQIDQATEAFDDAFDVLRQVKARYANLEAQRIQELNQLQQEAKQRQLDDYLQNCFLSAARIPGIGPGRLAALESYGVDSAFEIQKDLLQLVPGIGPDLTNRLLAWRSQKIREFRYSAARGVPRAILDHVELKHAQARLQLEQQIKHGPAKLNKIRQETSAVITRIDAAIARATLEVKQREADWKECQLPYAKWMRSHTK
ncbi:hypothetical protein DTL42_00480 [Bremerella cremea]|uniref:Protein kinase domain-containing protein n=1 Tax=Bremerella cremea TaxID=1031537 RepID=A0A368KZ21_9BACT|nr:hypothetical protein [Bremerella cremea]RCS56093.1 hypothetical protein DTL42_00480 [Bremerella cremea]